MQLADFIGTWRLVEYHNRTADGKELDQSYGPEFLGLFLFAPNGRLFVTIADGRLKLPVHVKRRPFSAYTGQWRLEGDLLKVDVDESFLTPFVGTTQVRKASFVNGRLHLIPDSIVVDGILNHRELVWERIGPI